MPNIPALSIDVIHVGGLFPIGIELKLYVGEIASPMLAPVRAAINARYKAGLLALTGLFQVNAGLHNPLETVDNALREPAPDDVRVWIDLTREGEPELWIGTWVRAGLRPVLTVLAASAENGLTNLEMIQRFGTVGIVRDLNRLRSFGAIIGTHVIGRNPDESDPVRNIRRFVLGSRISFTAPPPPVFEIGIEDIARRSASVALSAPRIGAISTPEIVRDCAVSTNCSTGRSWCRSRRGGYAPTTRGWAPVLPGLKSRAEMARLNRERQARKRKRRRKSLGHRS